MSTAVEDLEFKTKPMPEGYWFTAAPRTEAQAVLDAGYRRRGSSNCIIIRTLLRRRELRKEVLLALYLSGSFSVHHGYGNHRFSQDKP